MKTKSPLTAKPLRNPGESLNERINELIDDKLLAHFCCIALCIGLAVVEWTKWYTEAPHSPVSYTIVALLFTSYFVYKVFKLKRKLKNMRQGLDGEKAVGQFLDQLKYKQYRVFHDIVGENYNIDHAIICKHGVFSVETKTYSKPISGQAKIIVDDGYVKINGRNNEKIAIQAKAEAKWLETLILEIFKKKVQVWPVVLFPGWYIDSSKTRKDIWVLNPKTLPAYIEKQPEIFSRKDVKDLSRVISKYIRAN